MPSRRTRTLAILIVIAIALSVIVWRVVTLSSDETEFVEEGQEEEIAEEATGLLRELTFSTSYVNGVEVSKTGGTIENPSTGDLQNVRIYEPEASEPLPMVTLVPGGSSSGNTFEQTIGQSIREAEVLAAEGFVVVVYDPLGTGESQGELNFQGHYDQDGLALIISEASMRDSVDANNIGIASFSYGVTGATGVLARYPELGVKFYSDWEGPSSRFYTTVGCNSTSLDSGKPNGFSCADEEHWVEREAATFIAETNIEYYWRIQEEEDHVQPNYDHTLEMIDAAVGNIPWVVLNDGAPNAQYTQRTVPTVNARDHFTELVIPHLIQMAAF